MSKCEAKRKSETPFYSPLYRLFLGRETRQNIHARDSGSLPGEAHETWIQRNGQEEVAEDDGRERVDGDDAVNAPVDRRNGREQNHRGGAEEAEDERELYECSVVLSVWLH